MISLKIIKKKERIILSLFLPEQIKLAHSGLTLKSN